MNHPVPHYSLLWPKSRFFDGSERYRHREDREFTFPDSSIAVGMPLYDRVGVVTTMMAMILNEAVTDGVPLCPACLQFHAAETLGNVEGSAGDLYEVRFCKAYYAYFAVSEPL